MEMPKKVLTNLLIGGFIFGLCSSAIAGKPATGDPSVFKGNGFPSGLHHNLLIHGKPDTFTCPDLTYYFQINFDDSIVSCTYKDKPVLDGELVGSCEFLSCTGDNACIETTTPNYGNVVNMPRFETDDPITFVMESGRKGPKSQPDATTLKVTDWCTESFPDDGSYAPPLGDEARVLLPKDPDGYAVYARILGKPKKNDEGPSFVMVPEGFELIENEYEVDLDGDGAPDLLLLGFISPDGGVFNPDGVEINLKRSEGIKGNKAKTSTNISPLFKWQGDVCYVEGDAAEEAIFCTEGGVDVCSPSDLCCIDNEPVDTPDGVYDACIVAEDTNGDTFVNSLDCAVDYDFVTGACKYIENDWVFNIADFVNVLFNIEENKDVYNVQIRFYPLPLNQGE
jgi:hypothetical protein